MVLWLLMLWYLILEYVVYLGVIFFSVVFLLLTHRKWNFVDVRRVAVRAIADIVQGTCLHGQTSHAMSCFVAADVM